MNEKRPPKGDACLAEIIEAMERIAPPVLAETWDNCGLQVGSAMWPVKKIWIALDPLPTVIAAAASQDIDLVITHHPLLFHPMKRLDTETPVGKIIETALASRIAIYAAHTNLDSAIDGVNDTLARKIGLTDISALIPVESSDHSKKSAGMGRIGRLPEPMTVRQLSLSIKRALDLAVVKYSGNAQMTVQDVILCSGSGSGLLETFFNTQATVFISGDLRYHDARAAEEAGRALIDIGHFPSEHIIIDIVADKLRGALQSAGWSVNVEPCRLESDPFRYL